MTISICHPLAGVGGGYSLVWFALFLLFFNNPVSAQLSGSLFTNYSASDGLTDNVVHCIYQDSKGWLWVGTSSGIFQFDGYQFKKLSIQCHENEELDKSLVRTIFEDKNKTIWIGTENQGIFQYSRKTYELKHFKGKSKDIELPNNSVWDIKEDKQNNIWIATENGLLCIDSKTQKNQLISDSKWVSPNISNNFVRSLLFDSKDRVWVGTNKGITRINKNNNTTKNYLNSGFTQERIYETWNIFESSDGQIWAGCYLGGLMRYNHETDKFEEFNLDKKHERATTVRTIVEDNNNTLWIGTRAGLYSINLITSENKHYENEQSSKNSLAHNSVLSIFKDQKGDLWIGTRDGISFLNFDKQAFNFLTTGTEKNINLNNGEVYALWERPNGEIWIGTEDGGVNVFNPEKNSVRYITKNDNLSRNCIKAFCYISDNKLLIGSYLGGLNEYNLQTGANTYYIHNPNDINSISGNAVWAILKDRKNRIWIGTDGGVDIFDPVKKTFKHLSSELDVKNIVMLFEDRKGHIWMYYENVGMVMVDNSGNIKRYPIKARTMFDDGTNLWFGTMGNGLISWNFEKNKQQVYTTANGLCNNYVNGIINDNDKYLWISTKSGLSRFDKTKQTFLNFTVNDGLLNEQYNYGAYLICKNGNIVFGGRKGLDFIYTNKLRENNYNPLVVITDFKIFNKSVPVNKAEKRNFLNNTISETDKIEIDYDKNVITFEFAALNFANSNKNLYEYKLEGFDNDWNRVFTQRTATYTNLEPGHYKFLVKGSNNDGIFGSKNANLLIIVHPPFYKAIWFRILLLLLLLVIGYSIYLFISNREKLKHQLLLERNSARKMQELERLKHQFFMNISHEIRTPLTLIIGPLEKLLSSDFDKNTIVSHLEIVKNNAQNLVKLVNQLLDYRKLETGNMSLELKKGNVSDFLDSVVKSFSSHAADKGIKLTYRPHHEEIVSNFDADKIEKIFNNLISNALKYTPSGEITISINVLPTDDIDEEINYIPAFEKSSADYSKYIQVVVKDTGIGIPANMTEKIFNRFQQVTNSLSKSNPGTGIGLNITKELISIHNGHIAVKSREGKGSKFIVLIPFIEDLDEQDSSNIDLTDETIEHNASHHHDNKNLTHALPLLVLADDNKDIRSFIKYHFEPNYRVIEAANGQEAWDSTLETIPDLVIADIMMPVMDGFELCKKIKKDERTSHIPVLILTALASTEKQIAGIDLGVEDYITKPFDISILKAKADNILAVRKALRERYSREMILKPKEVLLPSPDEKFLKKVIAVIEKNIADPEFDIDKFAQHVGVSRTQLYRKVSALTNMSAKEFVKDIRLQRAAQLILQDKLNVSEIALEVGFTDNNYFRKCFKEKFGMSASEYFKNAAK